MKSKAYLIHLLSQVTYLRRCKASGIKAGILYMHDIASSPLDANLSMSKHLTTFYRVYAGGVSSTIVVPTIARGARLSHERIEAQISRLKKDAVELNAVVCELFNGQPETAWAVVQELLKTIEEAGTPEMGRKMVPEVARQMTLEKKVQLGNTSSVRIECTLVDQQYAPLAQAW